MASSRWRRFAFFDRSTLSLPDDAYDDLIPSSNDDDDDDHVHDDGHQAVVASSSVLFPDEVVDPPSSEYFSTATAVVDDSSFDDDDDGAVASVTTATTRRDDDDDVGAVRPTTLVPVPDGRGRTAFVVPETRRAGGVATTETSRRRRRRRRRRTALLLLASRKSPRLHVVDLSARCDPNDDDDDDDGWRGCLSPFPARRRDPGEIGGATAHERQIIRQHLGVAEPKDGADGPNDEDEDDGRGRVVAVASATNAAADSLHVAVVSDRSDSVGVCVLVDPHRHLSTSVRRTTNDDETSSLTTFRPLSTFDFKFRGRPRKVDVLLGPPHNLVAVGTDKGMVVLYTYDDPNVTNPHKKHKLTVLLEIPPPASSENEDDKSSSKDGVKNKSEGGGTRHVVTSLRLASKTRLYVCYQRVRTSKNNTTTTTNDRPTGVCCYELSRNLKSVESRFDLDARDVRGDGVCDLAERRDLVVARSDGLYVYSSKDRAGVAPMDGAKIAACVLPRAAGTRRRSDGGGKHDPSATTKDQKPDTSTSTTTTTLPNYVLVAAKDARSGRDVVDVYDAEHRLVAFHVLLSPGHRALRACALAARRRGATGGGAGGRSTAIVLTSGGAIVTLTEKSTAAKVKLLTQKNLYTAAITHAWQDPSTPPSEITSLYRRHAEHLYQKGDFEAAMDQYVLTVGSLEPSHVIFRFLDAPKIPLLARFLETLRRKDAATSDHLELLRACYAKLNDPAKAEAVGAAADDEDDAASTARLAHLRPDRALATICTWEAPRAAAALTARGPELARALPRETAGLVLSLCDGTYAPRDGRDHHGEALLEDAVGGGASSSATTEEARGPRAPVRNFVPAFLENPRLLRLVLAHCHKTGCGMDAGLRRTLLELTLEEWNDARRAADAEKERARRNQTLALLTGPYAEEIGVHEALVVVQLAGFTEGEVLLYEKLQIAPMLLERYAKDGGERARRQMLAMCRADPECLADVLGHFVAMADGRRRGADAANRSNVVVRDVDDDDDSEGEAVLDDVQEALEMAKTQGVLPPVRVARILAGEGVGQFSSSHVSDENARSVPLSVALNYFGDIFDEGARKVERLQAEVDQYTKECEEMEKEIESLRSANSNAPKGDAEDSLLSFNIQEVYNHYKDSLENDPVEESKNSNSVVSEEEFWREMGQSDDRFETIVRFFGKGVVR